MKVARYSVVDQRAWDSFVDQSDSGHFMFKRGYMDYHSDRFQDHSLIFRKGEKIMALLPANEVAGELISHQGLSFGGLVLGPKAYAIEVMDVFATLRIYMGQKGLSKLLYKAIPHIYTRGNREESLFALMTEGAKLVRRDLSSVIDLRGQYKYRSTKKQNIKKGQNAGLDWSPCGELSGLWNLIEEVLETRHDSEPTHNLEEIELLRSRFPENIKAYGVSSEGELLGGALLFIDRATVHTQYLAVNVKGRALGALDFLIDRLIEEYRSEKKNFSFGISTEDKGRVLNKGLIFQKEGFGARGIVHDFYEIEY